MIQSLGKSIWRCLQFFKKIFLKVNLFYFIYLFILFYLFIYFWLRWVFVASHRLFLWLPRAGATLRCGAQAYCGGFSCCRARALVTQASVVLRHAGLVAPWHVGSSRTRARTCVPCIGRRILNHCATREAQPSNF